LYCSRDCQIHHFRADGDLGHKSQCKRSVESKGVSSVDVADYYTYVSSLPTCNDEYEYQACALRNPRLVRLSEQIGYSFRREFFRMHEFLQALVAHGQDTEENMVLIFGFELSDEEHVFQDPFRVIGRQWFEARIAVACGVGAEEGTHAHAMGARPSQMFATGVPATPQVLKSLQQHCVPLSEARHKYGRFSHSADQEVASATCSICFETLATGDENAASNGAECSVQLLPGCSHVFHPNCILTWLQQNASCPVCRKNLPQLCPRPSTLQERNLARRLAKIIASRKLETGNLQNPLSNVDIDAGAYSGAYENMVKVVFLLSDELDFSGGVVCIAVSPNGKELAVSSTSIGKIGFISIESRSLTGLHSVGKGFPGGPKQIVYDGTNVDQKTIYAVVDDEIVKYGRAETSGYQDFDRQWSQAYSTVHLDALSIDSSGAVLISDSHTPQHRVQPGGGQFTPVLYDDEGIIGLDHSFHSCCILGVDADGEELPSGGVLSLPNGDVVFIHGLVLAGTEENVALGLLRKGQTQIEKRPVSGLPRSIIQPDDCIFWQCCTSPSGDIFILFNTARPQLIHITNPTRSGTCTATITALQGFRKVEEFGGICADAGHCVYVLVVCNWPCEREIYIVNPKQ
jgi:hypothetical protein